MIPWNYHNMNLNDICEKCHHKCNAKYFQQNFKNWTSGNNNIDKFIQGTQLSTHIFGHYHYGVSKAAVEWIPYDRLYNIKSVESRFGKMYKANWIDGNIIYWDNEKNNWKRINQNLLVILKTFDDPNNIESDFRTQITTLHANYGITQDPETKTYMAVMDNRCRICKAIIFQQYFNSWTSGNNDIDKFIQDSQLSDHSYISKTLEWIPYDRFCDIKYIAKGGFGKVYRAKWIDGYIVKWDIYNRIWERNGQLKFVALKSLNNSKDINSKFINEAMLHYKIVDSDKIIKFYGITQEPETKNYVMVLDYAQYGSLRNYLDENYKELSWNYKFSYLKYLASGLEHIHKNELIHRDLHPGNLLVSNYAKIADMGLCKPVNSENTKNGIYGVLPYIAPEILQNKDYTKAADIYSFGIIIYELMSGLPHIMM
ncbi:Tpk2p [Rhizophagus irregularis DAOM 197198w]|uniref:Tpk2p n=1 Tax=Rhizophagus irregularis (strain DAOM 197198w) TaxID=1432141 RepID=A0A015KN30_RHIIW|nr:Tpk2p [Rhizophagus irregularis DAOM 197198w]